GFLVVDPDDVMDFDDLKDFGKFEMSGTESEATQQPEFFLKFNLPCPPIHYCTDPLYIGRCYETSDPFIEFTFRLEKDAEDYKYRRYQ
ncbi:hypothetical protein PFISCL1PPCAC_6595, partial [Pristionchus fissidentatus]